MKLEGAEIRNIYNLCGKIKDTNNRKPMKVVIPYYQRPYRWRKEDIENLFTDYYKDGKDEYFVGSAVLVNDAKKGYQVIDGQQRLTTMFLLSYMGFLLQRAYIEEMLNCNRNTTIDSQLEGLVSLADMVFGEKIGNDVKELKQTIIKKLEEDPTEEDFDEALKLFQNKLFLPKKNLSDEDKYFDNYLKKQKKLLKKAKFALSYSRESYNNKLSEALSNCMIIVSNQTNPKMVNKYGDDELVNQYLQAIKVEFDKICELCEREDSPLTYVRNLSNEIQSILNNIIFCVVITEDEKDAYTLFEVLNDRSLEVEDLDLIKNLFYKWYCHNSGETDNEIDHCIEEVDTLWVDEIFNPNIRANDTKLISYLAAMYFTADNSLMYNENEKYRKSIEEEYLKNYETYNNINIRNDFQIYHLISNLIAKVDLKYKKQDDKYIEIEKMNNYSITYKCMHLLQAYNRHAVMSALVNVIIKKYVDEHMEDNIIDSSDYDNYLESLIYDSSHNNNKEIHLLAYDLWRLSLFSADYSIPRDAAIKIIEKNNNSNYDPTYEMSAEEKRKIETKFKEWCNNWTYSNRDNVFNAKILLLNLFRTNKTDKKLEYKPAVYTFNKDVEIQLDHMEAWNPDEANKEKYFYPNNEAEPRENYTNSLGNFMILDSKDNNDKNNKPLEYALQYYRKMVENHWMIDEVKEMLDDENSKYSKTIISGDDEVHVPNENYFIERRSRLIKYFLAVFERGLMDDEVPLD